MFKKALAVLGFCVALLSAAAPVHAQLQASLCLGDLAARAALVAQALMNVTQAARAAGAGTPLAGSIRLCFVNGRFVWEFNALGPDGRTQRRVLDAATGGNVPGI